MISALSGLAWGFLPLAASTQPLPASVDRNGDGQIVVACLGDSNTDARWQNGKAGGFPPESGWCERLVDSLGDPRVRLVNLALGGATVGENTIGAPLGEGWRWVGEGQLRVALEKERPDLVLLAFGTNDILPKHGGDPAGVADSYNRLWRRLRAHDVLGFVALTPPVQRHARTGAYRRSPEVIAQTNARIREIFPDRLILDFHTDATADDFLDDLHLNERGQAKRAREARRKIVAAASVTAPPAGVRALRFSRGHWAAGTSPPEPGLEPAGD